MSKKFWYQVDIPVRKPEEKNPNVMFLSNYEMVQATSAVEAYKIFCGCKEFCNDVKHCTDCTSGDWGCDMSDVDGKMIIQRGIKSNLLQELDRDYEGCWHTGYETYIQCPEHSRQIYVVSRCYG